MTERSEKRILLISFLSGLAFAIAEFIFSIYSRSHSALTDAVYDMSELVFIALLLFLTPLFHKPSRKSTRTAIFRWSPSLSSSRA